MKTSTKLLIALFACIPLAMLPYGYLLRQQFIAGNFEVITFPGAVRYKGTYHFKASPAFKHVVVWGNYDITGESPLTFQSSKGGRGFSSLEGYEDIMKTKISGDTLYVTIVGVKDRSAKNLGPRVCFLYINNGDVKSIKLNSGRYRIKSFSSKNLKVNLENASVDVLKSHLTKLEISADKNKTIWIDSSKIDLLKYSLREESTLKLTNNNIAKFEKLSVDSLSKISIDGNAQQMEKFLQETTALPSKQINNN